MDKQIGTTPYGGGFLPPQPSRVSGVLPRQPAVPPRVEEMAHPSIVAPTTAPVAPVKAIPDEAVVDERFTYDGYQVVRGEYFSHINEPSITFCDNRFSVNAACLKKSPGTEFVQVLVNQEEHKLAVRPCSEDVKDSFAWCTLRHKTKKVICPLFFGKIMSMMDWNPEHRYKIIGKMIRSQGQYLFVFDLNAREIYTRSVQIDENGKEKRKTSRKPSYPDSWKDHFGMPVEEHQKALQINIFDGYALIGVKEQKHPALHTTDNTEEAAHDQTDAVYSGRLPEAPNQDHEVHPSLPRCPRICPLADQSRNPIAGD